MKGILTKLDNQWMVRYDTFQNDHSYPLPAYNFLPLHLEYQTILPLDLDLEGNEVEFEMVHYDGKTPILEGWSGYAKLLDEKVTCEYSALPSVTSYTTAEYPELEGTMNLCNDIIEKRTGKMTEEEWVATENTQTSKTKTMTAEKYLAENSDWFDKSPGGKKLYFESEVIRMMVNFAETYGSKGSDDQFDLEKEMFELEGQLDIPSNKTSTQTEISDEEIEQGAMETMDYVYLNPNDSLIFHQGWMRAIKWYREQLKKK